ncbi:hypothetical protein [Euzebya tangerina]|uniref:hypothetical protein n=1 Tax=Euzebya tangerina TaxID=591198 RepID=UPI000E31C2EB|nr:hypothetical protein [Euzebya tangerina]
MSDLDEAIGRLTRALRAHHPLVLQGLKPPLPPDDVRDRLRIVGPYHPDAARWFEWHNGTTADLLGLECYSADFMANDSVNETFLSRHPVGSVMILSQGLVTVAVAPDGTVRLQRYDGQETWENPRWPDLATMLGHYSELLEERLVVWDPRGEYIFDWPLPERYVGMM